MPSAPLLSFDRHRCPGSRHHEHVVDDFIVEVNAHDRIPAESDSLAFQFSKRYPPRFAKLFFICAGSSAEDIRNPREQIPYHVRSKNCFPNDDAVILPDGHA